MNPQDKSPYLAENNHPNNNFQILTQKTFSKNNSWLPQNRNLTSNFRIDYALSEDQSPDYNF
jgi:hypothetical protein